MARLLIVEDELPLLKLQARMLARLGYDSVLAENGAAARDIIRTQHVDAVISDVKMPGEMNGIDLADQRLGLDPFFAKAEELGVLILLHPMGFTHADRMTDHYFNNIIGNPLESTLAVSHLIFAGVMDRYPRLKFCVVHGGGYLAHYHARMDHGWKARPDARTLAKKKPSSYLKKFFFDTVTFDSGLLDTLVDRYGARQVLLGSYYPFDMGDDNPVRSVRLSFLPG